MYNPWDENARMVEEQCGSFVDWAEGFYICPECGEPVYETEWTRGELTAFVCPICEWEGDLR